MNKLFSIIVAILFIAGCQSNSPQPSSSTPKAMQKVEKEQIAEKKGQQAPTPVSELTIPTTKRLTFRSKKSVANVYNGMGWRTGSDLGSAYVIEGREMAIYSPNDYTGELKALTLNIISYDAMNGKMVVKVGSTTAFGSGALNSFWISVPYAKGLVILKNGKLKVLFGLPAGTRKSAFGPMEIHEDITDFTLDTE